MVSPVSDPILDQGVVWRNGNLIPFAEATTHVLSHMSARGSQIFDYFLVVNGPTDPKAIGLRAHVARFVQSVELMGMTEVDDIGALEQAVAQTVLANVSKVSPASSQVFAVKIIAAWDEEANGLLPALRKPSVFVVATQHVGPSPFETRSAVAAKSATTPKIPAEILPPSMKVAASYTSGVREQLQAQAEGYDQVLFKSTEGDLAESTTLSALIVSGETVIAPPLDSVLDGITRRLVLDVAAHCGYPVEVRAIKWEEVLAADEVFLASSNNMILPIASLDGDDYANPGPVTAKLASEAIDVVGGEHELSDRWLTSLRDL